MKNVMRISIIALLAVLALSFASCGEEEAIELEGVEVRDYQGQDLSSVNDFVENTIKGPQYIDKDSYRLEITGLVDNPQTYTYDEVIDNNQHYKKVARLDCVEGWGVTILWEGVLFEDLLAEAGIQPKGKIAIFKAVDDYESSLPLEYLIENEIIIAHKMNDVVIPPERGFPFHLVAESKWGYKWVKWITEIEISDDEEYEGYWEKRGYSNTADRDGGFFD